jgi:hypothetical protein
MPEIPPTGARIGKHLEVPESAKGPAIDPAKGYRLQVLGEGLYMITDNCYQSMFMVYQTGRDRCADILCSIHPQSDR